MKRVHHVDVFGEIAYSGNPVAVVLEADELTDERMQRFATWTNLSETAFVMRPTLRDADYRVRIFTPSHEVAFAGHPTLGSCHAWLATGGEDQAQTVQECGIGLVHVRRSPEGLSFGTPPLRWSESVRVSHLSLIAQQLQVDKTKIVDARWLDNGLRWLVVLLDSAATVLHIRPGRVKLEIGVVGPYPEGAPEAYEVRAFFPKDGLTAEDPVTGSLNASIAQWLASTGRATPPYVASQGTVLGRRGRIHISQDNEGLLWIGGRTVTCLDGTVDL